MINFRNHYGAGLDFLAKETARILSSGIKSYLEGAG